MKAYAEDPFILDRGEGVYVFDVQGRRYIDTLAGTASVSVGHHNPVVIEAMHGLTYVAPARHTREYVEVLRAAFACTGNVEFHGEFFDFSSMLDVPGASPAYFLRRTRAATRLSGAIWSSRRERNPRKIVRGTSK